MRSTLVGIFDDRHAAEHAREELLRAGFADDEVDLRTGTEDRAWRESDERRLAADRRAREDETGSSIGETVAHWFRSLFGLDDDEDVGIYTEAVRRGESVVTVHTANEDRVDRASDILEACGSIDIDEKANEWQLQGWARPSQASDATTSGVTMEARATGAGAGDEVQAGESRRIPVIEEQLRVGKRIVGRRRMRVYTRIVEEPVEQSLRLTEERVHVERHDVDRPATEADYRAAQGGTIEATERSEEPVVSREARVVGEVEIGKEKREHQETVRDTVRRTDVDVQELDEAGRTAGASTMPTGTGSNDASRNDSGATSTGRGDTDADGRQPPI